MSELDDAVRAHYRARFGEPSTVRRFDGDAPLEVWTWDAETFDEGVNLYATVGASAGRFGAGCSELFVALSPAEPGAERALLETARRIGEAQTPPQLGDAITLSEPLWPGTEMRAFLLESAGGAIMDALAGHDELSFVQLVPLFPEEHALLTQRGEEALWRLFRETQVPYWDPRRAPAGA